MSTRHLVALAAAFVPLFGSANELHFAPASPATQNCEARPIFAADMNRDGKLDIVSGGQGGPTTVALGRGDGTFGDCLTIATTSPETLLAVADVDGDGVPDVLGNERSPSTRLVIVPGTSGATQSVPQTVTLPGAPFAVAMGDVTGDGVPEIAVSWRGTITSGVTLLTTQGGTFTALRELAFSQPGAVALADFDGDGKVDVIVSEAGFLEPKITYYRGHGDGTFDGSSKTAAQTGASDLIDLNGDGVPDAVRYSGGDMMVAISSRTTAAVTLVKTTIGSYAPVFRDVDGDHIPDCVSLNGGGIQIRKGHGDGTFGEPLATYAAPFADGYFGDTSAFLVGDFDGDGKIDVVARGSRVVFMAGNGDGTLRSSELLLSRDPHWFSPSPSLAAAAADLTHDGRPDVVIASQSDYAPDPPGTVRVYENADGRHFIARAVVTIPKPLGKPLTVIAADFDGDGHTDAAVNGPNGSLVLFGDGKGALESPAFIAPAGLFAVGAGSFAGDGRRQLVFSASSGLQTSIVQPARGGYTVVKNIGIRTAGAADVDGDGRTDLLQSAPVTAVGFNEWPTFTYVPGPLGTFLDVDGDGVLDLVTNVISTTPSLVRNHRDRTSDAPRPLYGFKPLAAADLNGDGKTDLIGNPLLYLNLGDGTFEATETMRYNFAATADFDGDGKADLLMYQGGGVVVALNRPSSPGSEPATLKFDPPGFSDPCCLLTATSPKESPTGGVTFRDGSTILGYASGDESNWGFASRPVYPPPTVQIAGPHTLSASYSGNATFAPASIQTSYTVAVKPVSVTISDVTGNFAKLPIRFSVRVNVFCCSGNPEIYGGKITVHIVNVDAAGEKIITADAAGLLQFTVSLAAGNYAYWADYSGDAIHTASRSDISGRISVYDYPIALDKTTITVTPTGKPYPYDYDVAVTFHDASGAPFTMPGGKTLDVRLTTSKGALSENPPGVVPAEALHWWLYNLGTPAQTTLIATIGGVPIAYANFGPPPPHRRAAGH